MGTFVYDFKFAKNPFFRKFPPNILRARVYSNQSVSSVPTNSPIHIASCFGVSRCCCRLEDLKSHHLLMLRFVAGVIFYSMAALLPQAFLYMFTSDPGELAAAPILAIFDWVFRR